jgi:hypothetical protein
VLAVHDYTDWYGGYALATSPFLTDMITWGKRPAALPRVPSSAPHLLGHAFTVSNEASQPSAAVEFEFSSPYRDGRTTFFAPAVLGPGESTVIFFDAAASSLPGIWHVDYVLRDSAGNEIQPVREALDGRLVVYSPLVERPVVNVFARCGVTTTETWTQYVPVDDLPCSLEVSNTEGAARSVHLYAAIAGDADQSLHVATLELAPSEIRTVDVGVGWERWLPHVGSLSNLVFLAFDANLPYEEAQTPTWARIPAPPGGYVGKSADFPVLALNPYSLLVVNKGPQLSYDPGGTLSLDVGFWDSNMQRPFAGVAHLSLASSAGGAPIWTSNVPIAYTGPSTTFQFAVPLPAGLPYGYYLANILLESDNGRVIHHLAGEAPCPANSPECYFPTHSVEVWVPEPVVALDSAWPTAFVTGANTVYVNVHNERRPHVSPTLTLGFEDPRGTFFQTARALGFLDGPPCAQGCAKSAQFDFVLPPMQINSTGRASLTFASERIVQRDERALSSAHALRLVNASARRGGTLDTTVSVERAGNFGYAEASLTCTLQETGESNALHNVNAASGVQFAASFAFPRNITSSTAHVRCEFSAGPGGSMVETFEVAAELATIKLVSFAAVAPYFVPKGASGINYWTTVGGDVAGAWPGKTFLSIPSMGLEIVKDSTFAAGTNGDQVTFEVPPSAAAGRHDFTLRARLSDTGAESAVTGAVFVRRPELSARVTTPSVEAGGFVDIEVKNTSNVQTSFNYTLTLKTLDGATTWAERQGSGWLDAGAATELSLLVPANVPRGTHQLVAVVRSTSTETGPTTSEAVTVDNSSISVGDVPAEVLAGTELNVPVANNGGRPTWVSSVLSLKDLATGQTVASSSSWLWVPAQGSATAGLVVPLSLVQKDYAIEYSVTDNNTGETLSGARGILVRNSVLSLGAAPASVLAGGVLSRVVSNTGSVPTTASYSVALKDEASGQLVASSAGWRSVPEHGGASIDLAVPISARTGAYRYEYTITNFNTGERLDGSDLVLVENSELSVGPGAATVQAGGVLTRSISNQGPVATSASYLLALKDPVSGETVSAYSGAVAVGANSSANAQMQVPTSLPRKTYNSEYRVTDGNTNEVHEGAEPVFVQNSELRAILPPGPLVAGVSSSFSVANDGEVATTFSSVASYANLSTGLVFATYSGSGSVTALGQASVALPVPTGIEQGNYRLRASVTDSRTGLASASEQDIAINASNLTISPVQDRVAAGAKALVIIGNLGAAAAAASWSLTLEPAGGGAVLASNTGTAEILPESQTIANVTVPSELAPGAYQVSVSVTDTRFGLSRAVVLPIQVEAADLSLTLVSGAVLAGESAFVNVVNSGGAPADYWIVMGVSDTSGSFVGYVERAGTVDAYGTTQEAVDVAPSALRGTGKLDVDCVILATGTHVGQSFNVAIQGSELAVSIGATTVAAGENLTATVQNIGEAPTGYSADAVLKDGSGAAVAQTTASGALGGQQSEMVALPVPSSLFGQFEFLVVATDGRTGRQVQAQSSVAVTNADLVTTLENPVALAGAASNIQVLNQGTLPTGFSYVLSLTGGGLAEPVALASGTGNAPAGSRIDLAFTVPPSVRSGQYAIAARTTADATGVTKENTFALSVLNAELVLNPPAGPLNAGGWSMFGISNVGPVGTAFSYVVSIVNNEFPGGREFWTGNGNVAGLSPYDVAFLVPLDLFRGLGTLVIQVTNGNTGQVAESSTSVGIENAELALTLPTGTLSAGGWSMFNISNVGLVGTAFSYVVSIVNNEYPGGREFWTGNGNVAGLSPYDVPFLVPADLFRGLGTLIIRVTNGNTGQVTESSTSVGIENAELALTLPAGTLNAGGQGGFMVENAGAVGTSFHYVVELSGGGLPSGVRAGEGDSSVGASASADVWFTVPLFISPGDYVLSVRVTAGNTGLVSEAAGSVAVENAVLSVSVPNANAVAGGAVDVHVTNSGPVGTAYAYRATVWTGGSQPPALFAGQGAVGASATDVVSLAVPADAVSGAYLLTVMVENRNTGARSEGEFEITVVGAEVILDEVLDKTIYLTTDSIFSTTNVQNGTVALPDSTLDLMILRRKPGTTDWPMLNRDPAHRSTAAIGGYIRRPASVWFDMGTFTPSAPFGGDSWFLGMMGSPVVGDVDGDGVNEVAMTSADAAVGLKVFDGRTGDERWRSANVAGANVIWGTGTPAIADLDGDGSGEVVAVSAHPGSEGVYAFRGDGTLVWTYATGRPFFSSVTAADLDRDGVPEILVSDAVFDMNTLKPAAADLHVLNADGSLRWKTESGEAGTLGASVGDVEGDRSVEIVVGVPSGRVTAFAADGTVKWSHMGNAPVTAPVTLADLDRDGVLDVVVVEDGEAGPSSDLYVLSGLDGALRWTSSTTLPGINIVSFAAPLLVDIDQDGRMELEVLASSVIPNAGASNYSIYIFSSDGQSLAVISDEPNPIVATPAVADIDGSGKQDLLVTLSCWSFDECEGGTVAISMPDFAMVWGLPLASGYASPAIADVTGDGHAEVVIRAGSDAVVVIGQTPLVPESTRPVVAGVNEAGQGTWDVPCADPLKLDCHIEGTLPFPFEFRGQTYERFRMWPRGEIEWIVAGASFVIPDLTPDVNNILGALIENQGTLFSAGETNLAPTCGFFGAKYLRVGDADANGLMVTADQVVFTWLAETQTDANADGDPAACTDPRLNTVQMVVFSDGRVRFTKDVQATDPAELRSGPFILDFRGRFVTAGNLLETPLPYDAGPTFMYDPDEEPWMPPPAAPFVDELVWQKALPMGLASGESVSIAEVAPPLGIEPGDYIFRASLTNSLRQLVGQDEEPFKLVAGEVSLALATDKTLYRRGADVDVVATVTNLSIATVSGFVEFYGQDDEFVSEQPFELGPSGQTDLHAVAAARRIGPATVKAVAFVGGMKIAAAESVFEVAESQVSVNVTAPDVVDDQPFEILVDISNAGPLDAAFRVELFDSRTGADIRDVSLAAGQAAAIAFARQITSDTTFALKFSGDMSMTRSIPIRFGMSAAIVVNTDPVYREGVVQVPVSVINTSEMQASYPVAFGLSAGAGAGVWSDVRWYPLYPAGSQEGPDRADDLLTFDLSAGTYVLAVETYGDSKAAGFTVARLDGVVALSPPAGTVGENEPFALEYSVTNTSLLAGNFSVHFMASGGTLGTVFETTETAALGPAGSVGDAVTRTLVLALPAGDLTLTAELSPGNTVTIPLHVIPREAVTVAGSVGAKDHGTLPVTFTVANVGSTQFDGVLVFGVGNKVSEHLVSVAAGAAGTVNVVVEMNGLSSGPQTATATVRNQAGTDVANTAVVFEVLAPVLSFVEIPPQTLEFVAGENATFGFTIQNTGDLPGSAALSFETQGMPRQVQVSVPAGASAAVSIAVPLREDLEELVYAAVYKLIPVAGTVAGSDTGTVNYLVRGVKVTARVEFDQPLYRAGETAHVNLVIDNIGSVVGKELYARVEYMDVNIDPLSFVLPADSISIPVDIPLSVVGGQLVYEVYTPATGLSIYLNMAFIQERPVGIQLYTDKQDYAPGGDVVVTVVSDAAGVLLLDDMSSGFTRYLDLAVGEPQTVSFQVPATAVSGTRDIRYVFQGVERFFRYNVAGTVAVVSRVTFDKSVYAASDTVRTDFLVKSSEPFAGSLYLMYFAPDGSTAATATLPVSAVSGQVVLTASQGLTASQSGTHRLVFSLFKDVASTSVELYVGEAYFNVGGTQLAGITVGKPAYESGAEAVDLTVYFSSVADVAAGLELAVDGVAAYSDQVAVGAGFDSRQVVLDASLFAGPGTHQVTATLAVGALVSVWTVEVVTQDSVAPQLSLAGVVDGDYYNAPPVIPTFFATDVNLYRVAGALNNLTFASGTPISEDGDYTLIVTAYDLANNETTAGAAFVIDTIPPDIRVDGVVEGGVYDPGVAADVSVTDAHPDTWSALLDGAPYLSGTPINSVGEHVLVVSAIDKATNTASTALNFRVKQPNRPPVIAISGVEDGGEYNHPVTAEIVVDDPDGNLQSVTITLDGDVFESGTEVPDDGDHLLEVSALDSEGASASRTVSFTIDQTAPTITLAGVADGECTVNDVTPVFEVTDEHLDTWSATLAKDGQAPAPFASGAVVAEEGSYTLALSGDDTFDNHAELTVGFKIDRTNPVIVFSGVVDGAFYNTAVAPVVDITETNLDGSDATLSKDGEPAVPFVPGTTITADGAYVFSGNAWDCAGNATSRSAAFVVDQTPPVITVTGVFAGGTFSLGVAANIEVTDRYLVTPWTVTLDGVPYVSGTPINDPGAHVLFVSASDFAGNTATTTINFSIVSEPCGNGTIDLYLSGVNPPACPDPAVFTDVSNRAQLDSWLTNPTTSLRINADIDFASEALAVNTRCDVYAVMDAKLTGLIDIFIAAREVDLYADLTTTGRADLRGQNRVTLREASKLEGATTLAIEAPRVDDHGDAAMSGLYCVEGSTVTVRQASRNNGGGDVLVKGDTVDLYGDFVHPGNVVVAATGDLAFRQASIIRDAGNINLSAGSDLDFRGDLKTVGEVTINAGGDLTFRQAGIVNVGGAVTMTSGGLLDFHGDLVGVQNVSLTSQALSYRQAALINASGNVTLIVSGGTLVDFSGQMKLSGNVNISTGPLEFRNSALITLNGDVNVNVNGRYDMRGSITQNGSVAIQTTSFYLYRSHELTNNASCVIHGTKLSGSVDPNGCTMAP